MVRKGKTDKNRYITSVTNKDEELEIKFLIL